MSGAWGPFQPGLEAGERLARLRTLRGLIRVLAGPRGAEAGHKLLLAEVDPDDEVLAEAAQEFDRLPAIDRRRVLASFAALLPPAEVKAKGAAPPTAAA